MEKKCLFSSIDMSFISFSVRSFRDGFKDTGVMHTQYSLVDVIGFPHRNEANPSFSDVESPNLFNIQSYIHWCPVFVTSAYLKNLLISCGAKGMLGE